MSYIPGILKQLLYKLHRNIKIKTKISAYILALAIFFIYVIAPLSYPSTAYAIPNIPLIFGLEEPYIDGSYDKILPVIKAPSAILIDNERGQVLYQKQADKKLHISTANKIMTAVLVIEKGNLEAKVTISKESSTLEGSVLFLTVGEKYTVEDLLNAIIITNANDAANALAEYIGGDISKFVEIMNNKAKELGMNDTHFANPTGLYDDSQYTTARDIGILMRYALSLPDFNRIFSYRAVPWQSNGNVRLLTNSNKLFWEYEGVDGGKTGYIQEDKQTAITTVTRNNRRLIAIVLDAPKDSVLTDSIKLFEHGFNNFKRSILVSKNQPLTSTVVNNKEINLISLNDVYYVHPIGSDYIKNVSFNVSQDLKPPLTKNTTVGIARYTLQDGTNIDVNLYPEIEIPAPESFYTKLMQKLKENRDIFVLLTILVVIEILIIIYKILKGIAKLIRFVRFKLSGHTEKRL